MRRLGAVAAVAFALVAKKKNSYYACDNQYFY